MITLCPSSVCRLLDYLYFQLLLQNRLMDFDETWYGWSTQGPLQVLLFIGQIRSLGQIQGGAKIGHGGPLLQETSSSDRKATAKKQMHSKYLEACGKKCCCFWLYSEVKFLMRFWLLFLLRQKKNYVFTVRQPTLIFWPGPKLFYDTFSRKLLRYPIFAFQCSFWFLRDHYFDKNELNVTLQV